MTDQNDMFASDALPENIADHLPNISEQAKLKWPETLATLIALFDLEGRRQGLDEAQAKKVSHAMVYTFATYCGGRYAYVPKADALDKAIRDVRLYKDWHDNNAEIDTLAVKYKLTAKQVYKVINDQRKYHISRIQPSLI